MGTKRVGTARLSALIKAVVGEMQLNATIAPETASGTDLGTAELRFGNIYCNDLNLANDRGDWTIIEEEQHLSIRNNKNGKLYKFVLEEIDGGGE